MAHGSLFIAHGSGFILPSLARYMSR